MYGMISSKPAIEPIFNARFTASDLEIPKMIA